MVLLHYVIEIFDFTDGDCGVVLRIIASDGSRIGLAAIDGDLLGHPMATDRLGEEPLGRWLVSLLREEKVNRLAALIYGPIEIIPLALDLDVRLVHPPAAPHRVFAAMEGLFKPWGILQDPAVDRRMVDRYSALLPQFFQLAIAQGIGQVPPHAGQDDVLHDMSSLEADHHLPLWAHYG